MKVSPFEQMSDEELYAQIMRLNGELGYFKNEEPLRSIKETMPQEVARLRRLYAPRPTAPRPLQKTEHHQKVCKKAAARLARYNAG